MPVKVPMEMVFYKTGVILLASCLSCTRVQDENILCRTFAVIGKHKPFPGRCVFEPGDLGACRRWRITRVFTVLLACCIRAPHAKILTTLSAAGCSYRMYFFPEAWFYYDTVTSKSAPGILLPAMSCILPKF